MQYITHVDLFFDEDVVDYMINSGFSKRISCRIATDSVLPSISVLKSLTHLNLINNRNVRSVYIDLHSISHCKLLQHIHTVGFILKGEERKDENAALTLSPDLRVLDIINCSLVSITVYDIMNAVPDTIECISIWNVTNPDDSRSTIPENIDRLKELVSLSISQTKLSSSVPNSLYDLTNLHSLLLREVGITGSIHKNIGQLISLSSLNVSGNQLRGKIPRTVSRLTNLKTLDLSNNRLSGRIPRGLRVLTKLTQLHLNNNRLTRIPSTMSDLTNLLSLDLSRNRLKCRIANNIFVNMTDLMNLSLHNNKQLSGYIELPNGRTYVRYKNTDLEIDHV